MSCICWKASMTSALAFACTLACAGRMEHSAGDAELRAPTDLKLSEVTAHEDLSEALRVVIEAYRSCTVSDKLRVRVPRPPVPWEDLVRRDRGYCGRVLDIISIRQDLDNVVTIEFAAHGKDHANAPKYYVTMATLTSDTWTLDWPLGGGLGMHPDAPME